jgi:cytochrome b pre-mRNA-processing protein 3
MPPLIRRSGEIEADMLNRLFRPSPLREVGRALYARVVEQSRAPGLYETLRAPDTVEGRFEIYSLHVVLLLDRLQVAGPAAKDVSQALFDTYVKSLDDALREMGVGDLSVGKKMRKLGEAFFGRVKNYHAAFTALPDQGPLDALLARTVYDGVEAAPVAALAAYVASQRAHLASQPTETFIGGRVGWLAP